MFKKITTSEFVYFFKYLKYLKNKRNELVVAPAVRAEWLTNIIQKGKEESIGIL